MLPRSSRELIVEFLHVEDPRWTQFLSRTRHDFYHLPAYVALCAQHERGTPVAFYAEHKDAAFLLPLIVRPLPKRPDASDHECDCVSPYGYPTPLLIPSTDDELFFARALMAFRDAACRRGIVSAFIRLHPLIELPRETLSEFGSVVRHGETVIVDLSLPEHAIWSQFRRNHKKAIVRLQETGFSTCMDDWSLLEEFHAIYMQTVRRVRAHNYYWFSLRYLRELRASLGSCVHLCAVMSPQRTVSAAALFVTCREWVQLHLIATADGFLAMSPVKLAIDAIWRWAKQRDHMILHLGGGVGARSDSVFYFKAGFSHARATFCTYRMVLDERKHDALVHCWRESSGSLAGITTDYFPIYRRELSP
jgi:Acetyltransferase (GNAT) domain